MPTKASTSKKPLTKSTKSKSKSRIAGLSTLNKKRKFNWKIAIIIVVVLVAALGYLFVRLSKASSQVAYSWAPRSSGFSIVGDIGTYREKSSGTMVVDSVGYSNYDQWTGKTTESGHQVVVSVNSNVAGDSAYCASVTGPGTKKVNFKVSTDTPTVLRDSFGDVVRSSDSLFQDKREIPESENGSICFLVPASAFSNKGKRSVTFDIKGSQSFYLNNITRVQNTPDAPPAPAQPDVSLGAPSPAPAPPAPAPNTPDCANMNNGIGNQNFCVSMIQLKLKQLGYGIEVDGIYGQKTADNVKLFQQKTGLTQDGVVGPRTWARMVQANSCADPAAKQGCTL